MDGEINKELLFNYFAGRATAFQKQMIDEWAKEFDNRELFFSWLHEWEMSNLQYTSDIDRRIVEHWRRMDNSELISEDVSKDVESKTGATISLVPFRFLTIAASVALILASFIIFLKEDIMFRTYKTSFGEIRSLELPDGSKVLLNPNSKLVVPRFGFGEKSRDVILEGEAGFEVKHTTDDKKFIVRTVKGIEVVVLGTIFNVYARPSGTKVVLNQGSVQLNYKEGEKDKQILMAPGDLVTLDDKGHTNQKKTDNPDEFSAWKASKIVFSETSLSEVATILEENYGINVLIPDSSLANLTVSGSFPSANAYELLELLFEGSGLSLQYTDEGNVIIMQK